MSTEQASAFNRAAEQCDRHRMVMVSSERVLINPRYDDDTDSRHNVKEFVYTYKCFGSCGQQRTEVFKPL